MATDPTRGLAQRAFGAALLLLLAALAVNWAIGLLVQVWVGIVVVAVATVATAAGVGWWRRRWGRW